MKKDGLSSQPPKKLRIGILGGSFNPVHLGHLHIAHELKRCCKLDEVWFIPAYQNPHKQDHTNAPVLHRLEMLRLAIESEPEFKVIDIECSKKILSYTVDTLKELKARHPYADFFLLLGSDAIRRFHEWKTPYEILDLCTLVVASRDEVSVPLNYGDSKLEEAVKQAIITTPLLNVSSTEIRKLISEGKEYRHLLPGSVADYIAAHALYYRSGKIS